MSIPPSERPDDGAVSVTLPAGTSRVPTGGSWLAIVSASGLPDEIQSLIRRASRVWAWLRAALPDSLIRNAPLELGMSQHLSRNLHRKPRTKRHLASTSGGDPT
jgi:hypothetical protein